MGGESGYDGHRKIKGRKRNIVVDTPGMILAVVVTAADVDDARRTGRTCLGRSKW